MFFTGTFSIEAGVVITCQKAHFETHEFDDDVVYRLVGKENDPTGRDGYVTNVGDAVTIHLKKYFPNPALAVALVKQYFALSEANGVSSVAVELFSDYDEEPAW